MKNDTRKGFNYLTKAEVMVLIDCSIGKLAGKFNLELDNIRRSLVALEERCNSMDIKISRLRLKNKNGR